MRTASRSCASRCLALIKPNSMQALNSQAFYLIIKLSLMGIDLDGNRPGSLALLCSTQNLSNAATGSSTSSCMLWDLQVLLALQRLLVAMGSGAGAADGFVVPVLRYACDPAGPEALNLLEDGLATWLTALRVAPAQNPQLTDLFPLLAAAMHASTGAPPVTDKRSCL